MEVNLSKVPSMMLLVSVGLILNASESKIEKMLPNSTFRSVIFFSSINFLLTAVFKNSSMFDAIIISFMNLVFSKFSFIDPKLSSSISSASIFVRFYSMRLEFNKGFDLNEFDFCLFLFFVELVVVEVEVEVLTCFSTFDLFLD